ncbi:MAG: alpha-L-fucosidase, partial [Bacteroidetes bacterium]|nr:alpha-L-fucosidase [Bacteroidota bacterium]
MKKLTTLLSLLFFANLSFAQIQESTEAGILNLNKPERVKWFNELGFGMFIHFSFDSQLGVVI